MTYQEQTWNNNDATTPINSTRLLHIEDGIEAAHQEIAALATVATTGSYTDLSNLPPIPATAADINAVPTTRTVAGHPLSADITLAKADVGLGNVDNVADASKAVLSAAKLTTARTINGVSFDGTANITVADSTKVPTTTTVNGKALSGNITLAASDVSAVPTTRQIAGTTLSADITASTLLTALGINLSTIPIVVMWSGSSWGTYSNDATRVRFFMSQNDAAATAPTGYNADDIWFGAGS